MTDQLDFNRMSAINTQTISAPSRSIRDEIAHRLTAFSKSGESNPEYKTPLSDQQIKAAEAEGIKVPSVLRPYINKFSATFDLEQSPKAP